MTIEPPILSEIQPPTGRTAAPDERADPGIGQDGGRVGVVLRVLHDAGGVGDMN